MITQLPGSTSRMYVKTTEMDGGQSIEHLQELQDEIMAAERPIVEIGEALGQIIENPHDHTSDLDTLKTLGRFLIGQNLTSPDEQIDRIFYAEGRDLLQSGAYSTVRAVVWDRIYHDGNYLPAHGLDDPTFRTLVNLGLRDIRQPDAWYAGAPVERMTRIVPLRPGWAENIEAYDNGYTYGHRQDLEEIDKLEVPDELKRRILNSAKQFHAGEKQSLRKIVPEK